MRWLDEIMGRKGWSREDGMLSNIGLLAIVHDTFRNNCEITAAQGDGMFGAGWTSRIERLKTAGVLHVEHEHGKYKLSVVCRGDKRRAKVAEAQKRFRNKVNNKESHT